MEFESEIPLIGNPDSGKKQRALEHDPEKWIPVFRKDHAPLKI
jgi:hypothetical protein